MSISVMPEAKRRKVDQPQPHSPGGIGSPAAPTPRRPAPRRDVAAASASSVKGQASQSHQIQQAKNFAIVQAQRDGCTANFRIFDSPYGNFLLPVVPTRAELAE